MSKYNYTDFEKQLNTVLAHQSSELSSINFPNADSLDESITSSEELLKKLGYKVGKPASLKREDDRKIMVIPTWEKLCLEAERHVGGDCVLEDLFTEDELNSNSDAIRKLNAEYSAIHHLDGIDISISAVAALTGAAIDLLLVGIPQKGPDGLTAGSLSNYVRAYFEKKFPSEEMEKLANSKESKVSFDAVYTCSVIIRMISRSVSRIPTRPRRPKLVMEFSTPLTTSPSPPKNCCPF